MGLDWNPGPKTRLGLEEEFARIWGRLHSKWCWNRSGKKKRFEEITVNAFDTLQTPRVGYDKRADEWARVAFEDRVDKSLTMEAFLKGMKGFYVLEVLPPCDGIPRYTNGQPGGYVERYSFRGQFLVDCTEIIGDELLGGAYVSKLPRETGEYGSALLARAQEFAAKRGMTLATVHEAEDPDTVEFHMDVVLSAGRWCQFWSSRGHWLEAYW